MWETEKAQWLRSRICRVGTSAQPFQGFPETLENISALVYDLLLDACDKTPCSSSGRWAEQDPHKDNTKSNQ